MAGIVKYKALNEPTVTTTSALVILADANRSFLLVENHGAKDVYLKQDATHVGSELGILIPAGGNWEPAQVPTNAFYAKTLSASSLLNIVEATQQ